MNYEQIDGNKKVLIDGLGNLSKNGTSPIEPVIEDKTGYKTFTTPIPGRYGETETRYVHVEVFRTHGAINSCPRLDPEDVVFVDEKVKPLEKLANLALSESGRAKVYGSEEVEDTDEEDLEEVLEEDTDAEEETINEDLPDTEDSLAPEELKVLSDTKEIPDTEAPLVDTEEKDVEDAEEAVSEKAFKWKRAGAYYDLIDPDSGDSVLYDFEVDKKPKGKDGAEELGKELADKFGIVTKF